MDARNTLVQHTIVGVFSLALVSIFVFLLDVAWSTSFARVSFILLFLTLIIGPVMRLREPTQCSTPLATPWSWRGELGIWFTLTALTHFIIVLSGRSFSELIKIGGSGYGLTNFIGLIALIWAIILACTSFGKVIAFLGVESWKWIQSFTYVIFYLVSAHFIYFQFFSDYGKIGPDWFGYIAVVMALIIILLQLTAFIITITKHRKEMVKTDGVNK